MKIRECEEYLNRIDSELGQGAPEEYVTGRIQAIAAELGQAPVLFYGVGGSTHRLFEKYNFSQFNIEGFLDRDQEKQGRIFQNKKIYAPDYLNQTSTENIVICAKESGMQIQNYLGENFRKNLRIYQIFDPERKESLSLSKRIFDLEQFGASKELIDLYLYIRDFKRALFYLEKMFDVTMFPVGLKDYLRGFPDQLKKSFVGNSDLPNICLITMDTARAANLNCYGYERETTPFLAELAKKSIFCDKAYSTSNWTIPSHASIFTGKMPFDHGACTRFSRMVDDPSLLTRQLKQKRYGTYGYVNIPFLNRRYGFAEGFDQYKLLDHCNFASRTFWEAFRQIKRNEPFFLFLNFVEAHDPYETSHYEWGNAYTKGEKMRKQYSEGQREISRDLIKDTINMYDDGIRTIDENMSYYFQAFPENTIFIITSDHGELFGENKMYGHMNVTLHDGVTRVPLVISGKGIKHQVVQRPVSISELYFIILEMTGGNFQKLSERNDGVFLERRRSSQSLDIDAHEFGNDVRAIVDGTFKLLEYNDGKRKLYLLPDEETDLLDNPEFQEIAARLTKFLHEKRGSKIQIKVNSLSDKNIPSEEKKKIEERLAALGYL